MTGWCIGYRRPAHWTETTRTRQPIGLPLCDHCDLTRRNSSQPRTPDGNHDPDGRGAHPPRNDAPAPGKPAPRWEVSTPEKFRADPRRAL